MTGGISLDEHLPSLPPNSPWLSQRAWAEIVRLSALHKFEDFYKNFYSLDKLVREIRDLQHMSQICI